jgi:hypothetical protein
MDLLVGCQRSVEMLGHHESMLCDPGGPSRQLPKLLGHRHISISVAGYSSVAVHLPNRDIGLGVTVFQDTLVVGLAGSASLGDALAARHPAHLLSLPKRAQVDDTMT